MTLPQSAPVFWNRRSLRAANALLLGGMLACASYVIVLIARAYGAQGAGAHWLIIAALAGMQAYRTRLKIATAEASNPVSLAIFAVDMVVILAVLKLVSYGLDGRANLWQDIAGWQGDFWKTFFSGQYVGLVLLAVLNYLLANAYADPLLALENDPDLLSIEKGGIPGGNRTRAFGSLTAVIFMVGGAVLVLAMFLNVDLTVVNLPAFVVKVEPGAPFLAAYFFFGLVMLALARYTMKEAHWFLLDIPIDPKIGRNWLLSAAALLGAISLVVAFLPTGYSGGLFDVLQSFFGWLVKILLLVVGFLSVPLILLLTALSSLFGLQEELPEIEQIQSALPAFESAPPETTGHSLAAGAQALIFWVVFGGVIFAAVRAFIHYNSVRVAPAALLGALNWLRSGWLALRAFFNRAGTQAVHLTRAGLQRLQQGLKQGQTRLIQPVEAVSQALPPRQRVLFLFNALARHLDAQGLGRRRAEPPAAYLGRLRAVIPAAGTDLETVQHLFIQARYTRQGMEPGSAESMQQSAENIRAAAQAYLDELTN